jgi:dihydrofolate synthase/folylpolyglutamate synthase
VDYDEAVEHLNLHINVEALPPRGAEMRLDTIRQLLEGLARPDQQYPIVHVTGTNGKTTTARIVTSLLVGKGLSVGTFTSPHLTRVNERLSWNGRPVDDPTFAELVGDIAAYEVALDRPPSWFEILFAAATKWFADVAVDAAVVEVGLGGRHDATNAADGLVAVVTNVGIDHVEYIGPTTLDIATEKAGIVKPGSTLILGETDPELQRPFLDAGASAVWRRGVDWGCDAARVALGGRVLDIHTPSATYHDVFLPLHGAHQGHNAAAGVAAAEAFFGAPLEEDILADAVRSVRSPGRMEIVSRKPLVILDGAHNEDGARAVARTFADEFQVAGSRICVLGVSKGHDPAAMLRALGTDGVKAVIGCAANTPRAIPAADVAAAAQSLGLEAFAAVSVKAAVRRALDMAQVDDVVLVTGSLYTVGAARAAFSPSD